MSPQTKLITRYESISESNYIYRLSMHIISIAQTHCANTTKLATTILNWHPQVALVVIVKKYKTNLCANFFKVACCLFRRNFWRKYSYSVVIISALKTSTTGHCVIVFNTLGIKMITPFVRRRLNAEKIGKPGETFAQLWHSLNK